MVTGDIRQYTKDNIIDNEISLVSSDHAVKIGISYDEKDPWFNSYSQEQQYKEFKFQIDDNKIIQIGKTDIYELTQPIKIQKISFPFGFPDSIKVDVVYYDKEGEQ